MLGIDYSLARPGGAAIKAAGYGFVMRYLASYAPKRLTASERDDLHANGLSIGVVFEDYANPKQNYSGDATATGVHDAQLALSQANDLNLPADRPIYFAVDYDAPESDQPWIDAYLHGAATIISAGRVGIYGGYYVVKRCLENGTANWGWQAVAWSGGQLYDGAHIYQDGRSAFNGGADIDKALKDDFGQWPITNNSTGEQMMVDKNLLNNMYTACFGRRPYNVETGKWDDLSAQGWVGQAADVVLQKLLEAPEHQAYLNSLKGSAVVTKDKVLQYLNSNLK